MSRSTFSTSVRLPLAALALGGVLLASTGCATDRQTGTLIGAAVGATIGYVIGSEADHDHHKHKRHHGVRDVYYDKHRRDHSYPPHRDPYCR
ncbi:glycine zipper domain-containing protein [Algisphaera agarilytica]|uniref:Outer membrane lipoprotein SlyB n=1 Tax=Algisphaera agarilytica TaxID=1385975 RepID=A0A7X0H993_9BACT|nr:glycine zipper domain-containing protein [Algisphaera agarilytica]MBB6431618.1 outer membrane lipoprotein SlyB [Algisphaera agarilytica]